MVDNVVTTNVARKAIALELFGDSRIPVDRKTVQECFSLRSGDRNITSTWQQRPNFDAIIERLRGTLSTSTEAIVA